jgi:hypothetical protein
MSALRRGISQHPFVGGFVGLALFGGVAVFFGTSYLFVFVMALFGFILGAGVALAVGEKRGEYDEIDAALRDGRGEVERVRLKGLNGQRLFHDRY